MQQSDQYLTLLLCLLYQVLDNPSFVTAYYHKVLILAGLKRYEEALATCEQALIATPNAAFLWETKADVLQLLGRDEEAQASKEHAQKLCNKPR
jgi:tetratricopeptide (TPR) repeat protein